MAQTHIITQEIVRDDWPAWLESFSRQHQGWIVTVTEIRSDIGAQELAANRPIQGISATLKGPGKDQVEVILGRLSEAPWTRIINDPSHIRFETTADGTHLALQVEASGGGQTLIAFRAGARPEEVNGILPES